MTISGSPALLRLYTLLTTIGAPFIALYLNQRLKKGKEDPARFPERLGMTKHDRPPGKLLWCHAASVGEAISVLTLLKAFRAGRPEWTVLLTTGTVTSARLVAERLPLGFLHQFVPVDRKPYVERFLDHWKPDMALWMESELWPHLLGGLRARDVPTVLLNARMSENTFSLWQRFPKTAENILSTFTLCLAQTPEEQARYEKLGATRVECAGNLKYAAEPLPFDEGEKEKLATKIGDRPVWLMVSTHPGEEEIAANVHRKLQEKHPRLLTVIAPRHPHRGEAIAQKIREEGLSCARRSQNEALDDTTALYLADTMGELGVLFRAIRLVCVGGSFTWGGHNPIEPAQLGNAILFGPLMTNFLAIAEEMTAAKAARQIETPEKLAEEIEILLASPAEVAKLSENAVAFAGKKKNVLVMTMEHLKPIIEKIDGGAA